MRWPFPFPRLGRTYRHVVRFRQVLDILVTEGFGFVVVRMNLQPLIHWPARLRRYLTASPTPLTLPAQLRRVVEELGPTYIKLGQMLASRPDLLPVAYLREFSQLQDRVAPLPFARIRPVLEQELGKPVEDAFASFDVEPLASASLAQVYAATLPSGEEVVVKVQRPGVRDLVRTDLEILEQWAGVLVERFPALKPLDIQPIVEEFSLAIKRELDFSSEAGNTDRLRRNLEGMEGVRVPRVFWDYTTDRLLVQERLRGIRADDVAALDAEGVNREDVARRLVACFMKQVFEDGFYHADPHPGNVLVADDGVLQLVDVGATGYLTRESLQALGGILVAFHRGDYDRVAVELVRLGATDELTDMARFKNDAAAVVGRYYAMPLRYMRLGTMFEEILVLARRNGVRLPAELALLVKTVMLVESLARTLDADLRFLEIGEPYARRLLQRRYSPGELVHDLGAALQDANYYLKEVPRDISVLLKRFMRGAVRVELEHRGLPGAIQEIDRSSNRLSFALIVAAIIVSSAVILVAGIGPRILGYSALGIVGFLVAGLLGLWLVFAILRSGRL